MCRTPTSTELWDLSLVDPDNRRPVDYDTRRALLAELPRLSPEDILRRADEGLPKLHVVREALHLRRRRPECFDARSSYEPLSASGEAALHTLAFVRAGKVATVVPRLTLGRKEWGNTSIDLPAGRWRNVLSGGDPFEGTVTVENLLGRFPVALLEADSSDA